MAPKAAPVKKRPAGSTLPPPRSPKHAKTRPAAVRLRPAAAVSTATPRRIDPLTFCFLKEASVLPPDELIIGKGTPAYQKALKAIHARGKVARFTYPNIQAAVDLHNLQRFLPIQGHNEPFITPEYWKDCLASFPSTMVRPCRFCGEKLKRGDQYFVERIADLKLCAGCMGHKLRCAFGVLTLEELEAKAVPLFAEQGDLWVNKIDYNGAGRKWFGSGHFKTFSLMGFVMGCMRNHWKDSCGILCPPCAERDVLLARFNAKLGLDKYGMPAVGLGSSRLPDR
mmetsp:Transcript_108689/g.232199  ORF Transcript_108689/g.232199 Transcript_108689/m.232199 type:complete len:282 (+) Transcript_108689:74-919(+)